MAFLQNIVSCIPFCRIGQGLFLLKDIIIDTQYHINIYLNITLISRCIRMEDKLYNFKYTIKVLQIVVFTSQYVFEMQSITSSKRIALEVQNDDIIAKLIPYFQQRLNNLLFQIMVNENDFIKDFIKSNLSIQERINTNQKIIKKRQKQIIKIHNKKIKGRLEILDLNREITKLKASKNKLMTKDQSIQVDLLSSNLEKHCKLQAKNSYLTQKQNLKRFASL